MKTAKRKPRKSSRNGTGNGLPKLDSLTRYLTKKGWNPGLAAESYKNIAGAGFRGENLALAAVATEIALNEQPITLRGLMYRVVSAGWLPSTDRTHYTRLGRLMTRLRERGDVPFSWIVDNVRSTIKPPSWSGLESFVDTVARAYRKDFWARLPEYVHVIVEKDAIAGVLYPITRKYDVALSPIRGYASVSFAHEIAETWKAIQKPIHAYYLGDFDPSGFDIERDLREKLRHYSGRSFQWHRLAVNAEDFEEFNLIPLEAKAKDRRYAAFIAAHGAQCAEVDALPPTELRRRVEESILAHVPKDEWKRLQETERREKESFNEALAKITA